MRVVQESVAFPPRPEPFRGRTVEVATLAAACRSRLHPRLALVGAGGSGKSTLAAALGYRVRADYPGGIEWFRVGIWDHLTLVDMLAIRLRVALGGPGARETRLGLVRRRLEERGGTLVVLDNHENDRAMARFLSLMEGLPVSWLLTARRCLLSGVSVYPVVSPLVTAARSPFRAVAALTQLLRWNALALDVSNALVESGAVDAPALGAWLDDNGVGRVAVIAHEDDLPEIRLLVAWVWPRLGAVGRRLLTVLAHLQGDHTSAASIATLARAGNAVARTALQRLETWHLVQQPLAGRYTLHATIKHAVVARTAFDQRAAVRHFVTLLERHPERLDLEQTHLFAAMDHAHTTSDLGLTLRLQKLLDTLGLA